MAESAAKRVALVTGGTKRVGRAIVEKLLAEDFDVFVTFHRELPADLEAKVALAFPVDLTDPATTDAVEAAFIWDRLDVLVNNASLYEPSPLQTLTTEHLRKMMAIHLESPLRLCQLFEHRLRTARGHVVNMVDLLAERPWPQ